MKTPSLRHQVKTRASIRIMTAFRTTLRRSREAALRVVSWNLLRRVGARARGCRQADPRLSPRSSAAAGSHRRDRGAALAGRRAFLPPSHAEAHLWPGRLEPASFPPHRRRCACRPRCCPGGCRPAIAQIVKFQRHQFRQCASVPRPVPQPLAAACTSPMRWKGRPPSSAISTRSAPSGLPDFRDIGPRQRTHRASNIVSLRLDRCMARDVALRRRRGAGQGPVRPSPHSAGPGACGERASGPRRAHLTGGFTRNRRSADRRRLAKPTGLCPRRSAF